EQERRRRSRRRRGQVFGDRPERHGQDADVHVQLKLREDDDNQRKPGRPRTAFVPNGSGGSRIRPCRHVIHGPPDVVPPSSSQRAQRRRSWAPSSALAIRKWPELNWVTSPCLHEPNGPHRPFPSSVGSGRGGGSWERSLWHDRLRGYGK